MPTVLHILTQTEDPLASTVVTEQAKEKDVTVQTFDLTKPAADYDRLLAQIFKADSVQVW